MYNFILSKTVDTLAEIIPSPNRRTIHNSSELQASIATIVVSQDS